MAKKKSDLVSTRFDYQALSQTQRQIVEQRTGEIRDRLQRSAQDIWEIGQRLAEVRSTLKHGQFEAWLKAEFGWSRRTAYNFINVYETFPERANFAQIDIATSALYLLAAPSTPSDVREASLREAESGKKITHRDLRDRIEQEKAKTHALTGTNPKTPTQPEIVALISRHNSPGGRAVEGGLNATPAIDVDAVEVLPPDQIIPAPNIPAIQFPQKLKSGWYVLDQQHFLFYGDTATAEFYEMIDEQVGEAAFALAATGNEWDHDWLIEAARSITILPEAELQGATIEQLITLFSQPRDTILFPWLPHPEMVAIAHRLGRKVIAGDARLDRCQQVLQAAGLSIARLAANGESVSQFS